MKPFLTIFIAVSVLLMFSQCGGQSSPELGYAGDAAMNFEDVMEVPVTSQPVSKNGAASTNFNSPVPNQEEELTQKLVKTGGITFESSVIEQDYARLKKLLPAFGGYIEKEYQNKTDYRITYELTIRVPAEQYDPMYDTLSNLVVQPDNRYSNVEDVTERYYDLQTRIKNKKALEARYIQLLQKATKIQDILDIEDKLNRVRIEIERLEGQFRYLSKRIGYSSIELTMYQVIPRENRISRRDGFGERLSEALYRGWQGFLAFTIGLLTLWPFLLLTTVAILLFRRWRSKRKARKSAPKDA